MGTACDDGTEAGTQAPTATATAEDGGSGESTSPVGTTAEPDSTTDSDDPGGDDPGDDEPGGGEPDGDEPGGDEPGGDEPGGDEPGGDEPGGDEPGGDDPAELLFKPGTIAQFDLELSQESIDNLNADGKSYVTGDLTVTLDGEAIVLPGIGVRLKGNAGSLRDLNGKAGFLLNFDRFVDDQQLFGMEKLALNNMVQDPSMEHEVLAYELFRAGGVPASRAAHAVVTVNGEAYGLYTTVESVDNEEFLERWYGDDKGVLYEGAYGSDLFPGVVDGFDLDNGKDPGSMQLVELAAAIEEMYDPNTFVAEVGTVIDLDLYLTFAATELYLGHWDGYAWGRNNFFIHRRTSDQRWVFMPWGLDQVLSSELEPFGGAGRLSMMCIHSTECRDLLAQKYEEVIARVDELGLATTAQTLADVLRPAAEADPRKEYEIDAVDSTVASNIVFLQTRGAMLLEELSCIAANGVVLEDDGYGGCDGG